MVTDQPNKLIELVGCHPILFQKMHGPSEQLWVSVQSIQVDGVRGTSAGCRFCVQVDVVALDEAAFWPHGEIFGELPGEILSRYYFHTASLRTLRRQTTPKSAWHPSLSLHRPEQVLHEQITPPLEWCRNGMDFPLGFPSGRRSPQISPTGGTFLSSDLRWKEQPQSIHLSLTLKLLIHESFLNVFPNGSVGRV